MSCRPRTTGVEHSIAAFTSGGLGLPVQTTWLEVAALWETTEDLRRRCATGLAEWDRCGCQNASC